MKTKIAFNVKGTNDFYVERVKKINFIIKIITNICHQQHNFE